MIDLEALAQWVQSLDGSLAGSVSAGSVIPGKEQCVAVVYRPLEKRNICIGGEETTKVLRQNVSLLVHWTAQPETARKKAQQLYELLCGLSAFSIGGVSVCWLDPGVGSVLKGQDEQGIYEYTIDVSIYFERMESI